MFYGPLLTNKSGSHLKKSLRNAGLEQTWGCRCGSDSLLPYGWEISTGQKPWTALYSVKHSTVFAVIPWGQKLSTNGRVASILTFLYLMTNYAFSGLFKGYLVSRWACTELSVYMTVITNNARKADVVVAGVVCCNLLSRHSIIV
jgi:hypothetical protein